MARVNLNKLNPPQREAVTHGEGPLLVLAGAGSGKTRVIVHRIAHLIDRGHAPESILAVTFTNKAAAEMRARVAALVGRTRGRTIAVSTFHAFGYGLVKRYRARLGLPSRLAVADGGDQVQLVQRALRDVKVDDRRFDVYRLLALLSRAKDEGGPPPVPIEGRGDDYELMAHLIFERYQRSLSAMAMVDFDDLIGLPLQLLQRDPEVQNELRARYQHLLVDEYQDTNAAQLRLLKLLAGDRRNLCAVGDDDQSIYGWRGARIENILKFERHFPGGGEIRLTQNYRSSGAILACANGVIRENPDRRPKDLWTDRGDGDPVQLVVLPGEEEEARFVAERIGELQARGRPLSDIAVLFRTNAQSRPFEESLRAAGLPYDLVGGTSFFERKEVKDFIAYLKLIANSDDELSLLRIINVPTRGIGDTSLEKLRARALAEGLTLTAALSRATEFPELATVTSRLADFLTLMADLRRVFHEQPLGSAGRTLIERVGLNADPSEAGAGRTNDLLQSLCQSLKAAEKREDPTLTGYLERLALEGRREEATPGEGNRCILMTLHSAKGLEFPVVFLVGLEEGILPHGGMQGQPPDLTEERRLCYVGMTRARESLTLTRAASRQRRGRIIPQTPSRFLSALPEERLQVTDLAARATPTAPAASKFWALVDAGGNGEAVVSETEPSLTSELPRG